MTERVWNICVPRIISTHILTRRMTVNVFHCLFLLLYFNSHPHEEDDRLIPAILLCCFLFQLTSSRGGWPACFLAFWTLFSISTHILTRRMTTVESKRDGTPCISTHILTRRMTSAFFPKATHGIFQLTSSRGGWQFTFNESNSCFNISTHILTRRMTVARTILLTEWNFNSHPHEEDDTPVSLHL